MFAVRDQQTGKFLRDFSGSLNEYVEYRLRFPHKWDATPEEIEEEREKIRQTIFTLDTPNGAKLYRTQGAVSNAFYSRRRWNRTNDNTLAEACPWLQIVPVKSILVCEE